MFYWNPGTFQILDVFLGISVMYVVVAMSVFNNQELLHGLKEDV